MDAGATPETDQPRAPDLRLGGHARVHALRPPRAPSAPGRDRARRGLVPERGRRDRRGPAVARPGPSAVELLDALIMKLARENLQQKQHVDLLPGGSSAEAVLYIEFRSSLDDADAAHAEVRGRLDAVRSMFPEGRVATHTDAASMDSAWALRKAGEPLLHAIPGDRKPVGFIEDAAVPPENLAAYVRRLRADHRTRGHHRVLLRPRQRRRAPCPPAARSLRRVRPRRDGTHRGRLGRPREGTGRRHVGRARRRARPRAPPRALLRPGTHGRLPNRQGGLRPREPPQPGQHRRAGPDRIDPRRHPRRRRAIPRGSRRDLLRFLRSGRPRPRREPVQRRGGLPQDERGGDVPVVPRHARRTPRDPRARQRPAPRDHWAIDRIGDRRRAVMGRPRNNRDARLVPLVQGVQERVPQQCGCREDEGGVHGAAAPRIRPRPAPRPCHRLHPHTQPPRGPRAAAREPGRVPHPPPRERAARAAPRSVPAALPEAAAQAVGDRRNAPGTKPRLSCSTPTRSPPTTSPRSGSPPGASSTPSATASSSSGDRTPPAPRSPSGSSPARSVASTTRPRACCPSERSQASHRRDPLPGAFVPQRRRRRLAEPEVLNPPRRPTRRRRAVVPRRAVPRRPLGRSPHPPRVHQ
jgi:hypothetical protein